MDEDEVWPDAAQWADGEAVEPAPVTEFPGHAPADCQRIAQYLAEVGY